MSNRCQSSSTLLLQRLILGVAVLLIGVSTSYRAEAQTVALKNNLAYDALLTPNLSMEVALGKQWTMDLQYGANFFFYENDATAENYKTKKWSHWMVQPELRYWFCEAFNGWFLGLHAQGGQANVGGISIPFVLQNKDGVMKDNRYEVDAFYGGGLAVGYQWLITPRFSMEFELGAGYNRIHYNKYTSTTCGGCKGKGEADYVGPTKAAISLVFFLK